jgi:hypothetical protein
MLLELWRKNRIGLLMSPGDLFEQMLGEGRRLNVCNLQIRNWYLRMHVCILIALTAQILEQKVSHKY